ncbi:unnamed protein product, partial [Prorocentrum cordatum]
MGAGLPRALCAQGLREAEAAGLLGPPPQAAGAEPLAEGQLSAQARRCEALGRLPRRPGGWPEEARGPVCRVGDRVAVTVPYLESRSTWSPASSQTSGPRNSRCGWTGTTSACEAARWRWSMCALSAATVTLPRPREAPRAAPCSGTSCCWPAPQRRQTGESPCASRRSRWPRAGERGRALAPEAPRRLWRRAAAALRVGPPAARAAAAGGPPAGGSAGLAGAVEVARA